MNGMDETEKKEFIFESPDSYKFLSNGNVLVAGLNDAQEYADTREAMDIMGLPEEEQSGMGIRMGGIRMGAISTLVTCTCRMKKCLAVCT